jgi:pSer/pThr/pTyr-binding forkhead associated (FHA) protein
MEASLNGPSGKIPLTTSILTIGRAADNMLVLPDQQSSSHHAQVQPDAQGYAITDLNSTNGTFVNEQRIPSQVARPLISGDVIRIGTTRFTYELAGSYDATMRAGAPDFSGNAYQPTVFAPPASPSSPAPAPANPSPQPGYQQYQSYPDYPAYSQEAQPPSGYGMYGQDNLPYQQPQSPPSSYAPDYQQQYPAQNPQNYPLPQADFQQQWGPAPGQMGVPGVPPAPAPPPKRKNRTGLIIALVVLLLVLVGGGLGAYFALRSTPEKTLTAFCTAIKNNDAQGAYNQLGTDITSHETEQQYATGFARSEALINSPAVGGLKDCTVSNVQQNGSTATGTVILSVNKSSTTVPINCTLRDENGGWKIENGAVPGQ